MRSLFYLKLLVHCNIPLSVLFIFLLPPSLLSSSVLCCSFYLCLCALVCGSYCLLTPSPPPFLGYINPSGEPIVPRGPQLSVLSLLSSPYFSPGFPWCWPNPLAANGEPERHRHLSPRQLCLGRQRGRLRQPVPHSAVLPVHRVALQQVRPHPGPRGCLGTLSIGGQYPEGPKVKEERDKFMSNQLWLVNEALFFPLPFPFSLNSLRARFTKDITL